MSPAFPHLLKIAKALGCLTVVTLYSCGVKAPPVGYKPDEVPHQQILVCTPKYPECELTDPKYVPKGPPYEALPEKN